MAYIKGEARPEGCIFCELPAMGSANDEETLILSRGEHAYIIMNKFPYNSGHLMVSPYRHCGRYQELEMPEHADLSALTSRCVEVLDRVYEPQGYNIGVNQGRAAGAGIVDHIHLHIVPRWHGDTNYMTTVGDTKVLPESLEETYRKLRPLLT